MTILRNTLRIFGIQLPVEAEPETAVEAQPGNQLLRQMTASRDDWKELAGGLQAKLDDARAKFKKAVADLAAASEEMEGLKLDNADLRQQITALRPDAILWRNARDKRAKRGGK